jgi:hypothetical protein
VIEVDASPALSRREFVETMNRLGRSGVVIAIADECGSLDRLDALYELPAGLLRLPLAAIDSVSPEEFLRLLTPWLEGGRGVIADGLPDTRSVPRLSRLNIGYIQGDALAASGPRLDFHFEAPMA